ncbi:MAG: hypothetical protein QN168_05440 [Armatimonadota bacterium]|nr:hypothetical protein [Armatimonadota bacterium]
MALRDAIEEYHRLLTDELAADSQAQLDVQHRRRGLFFGERPICTVLRPRFLTPDQYRFIRTSLQGLLRAFDRAYRLAVADPGFRRQFGLTAWEEALVQDDPGFRDPSPTSRIDAFFTPETGELWVTEYNAETPAAIAYSDVLADVFYALPVMREFLRRHQVQPLPGRHNLLHVLLDAYRQWSGRREVPRIAILDWHEVPTYSEFVLFHEYFTAQGLRSVIADPRQVEYYGGRLWAAGEAVDLIYKRVLLSELVDRGGLAHPVIRAVRERAVCMVNPFRCKILHKKASLAVLSDERNAGLFSSEERRAIAAHIPWTRRVEERRTEYRGAPVDLVPFVLEHRERFVLKPDDEYGGKGVVLGWETGASDWERAVQAALDEPSVVQERVPIPREPYPSLTDGRVVVTDRMLDTNPYVYYGDYVDGCMTRLSTAALLNVSAGGGSTVATYIVEER